MGNSTQNVLAGSSKIRAVLGSCSITAVFYQTPPACCLFGAERVSDRH